MTGYGSVGIHQYANQREIGTQTRSGARKGIGLQGGLRKVMVVLGLLVLSLSLYAQTGNLPAERANTGITNPAELKLPVAHAHFGSWCMGFLTIAPGEIRYDAVRSHGSDDHSFSLKREEVLFLNYWALAGQPMNAVEIRTATKNYHFWLMQSARALEGMHSSWSPVIAAPSDSLLLSLYFWKVTGNVPNYAAVNAALARTKLQLAQAGASGNGSSNDAYEKMNQHIYADTYSNSSVHNQINSISHMSHW
jgi:hypothetical protein